MTPDPIVPDLITPDTGEFRSLGHQLVDRIADYLDDQTRTSTTDRGPNG